MNGKERVVWSLTCGLAAVDSCVIWLGAYHTEHVIALDPTISLVLFGVLGVAPWRDRFSLRALFIGMTLVCVGLGFAVWYAR